MIFINLSTINKTVIFSHTYMNMYHKNKLLNEGIWIFEEFSPWDLYKGIKEDYMIHIFWARHDALTTWKREIGPESQLHHYS